jgi:peptidoglycan/xylan/chitin deacetylase (PgdA/CDA1 family)
MKQVIVTTSWDDGHKLDLKLAQLLLKYNIKGTFYISPENHEMTPESRIGINQIKKLSENFEIGAHTMTHPVLSKISNIVARQEIVESKKMLENILSNHVISFCYPGGDYKLVHKKIVEEVGFKLARTVDRFCIDPGDDCFAIPTTVHAYRHWSDAILIFKKLGMEHFLRNYLNWDELAVSMFNEVEREGGVFHLWGHSWEIEENKDWERLEKVFKHISNRPKVKYVTNGQIQ